MTETEIASGTTTDLTEAAAVADALVRSVGVTVRGKDDVVRLAVVALLAGGHLLVEDQPGTGKTLLAKSLAASIGGSFGRVQCTPDLLPGDLTGTTVYSPADGTWTFRPGPLFANVVLVDEVNRASPRTQSALLEPMEERQVSADGSTHPLPDPFFCIATQNPFGQIGTFPLPESQLDRFTVVVTVGYPDAAAEREILTGEGGADRFGDIGPVTTPEVVARVVDAVRTTYVAPPLVDYVLDLAAATRSHPGISVGASPRASVSLLRAAQAHGVVEGRDFVTPDDVQAVLGPCWAHRISTGGTVDTAVGRTMLAELAATRPVPRP
ncbi:MAG: MoxR family ATPase [Actinobacteria bacterium]|nr:MoxR family ATPase [Actinomycetota bacterium]